MFGIKPETPVNRFSLRPDQTFSRALRRKGEPITTSFPGSKREIDIGIRLHWRILLSLPLISGVGV
jgi:hypothetical protein